MAAKHPRHRAPRNRMTDMHSRFMKSLLGLGLLTTMATAGTAEPLAAGPIPADAPDTWTMPDDPALPRVLLIGDSISFGYSAPVRELLRGTANVHRLPENGGPTTNGLEKLDAWLGDGPWAVIHFNFGLHDIKLDDEGRPLTPPAEYEKNLHTITTRLKATGARLVFATTTPVPARLEGGPRRRSADVVERNGIARRVMADLGVPVNDLYTFAFARLAEIQRPANVHFTDEGSRALAEPVAAAIRKQLNK